jgi:hypothetical protein
MKTTIFLPKTINVGFQNRTDTYTKKLAYVIYFDQKGKLRKEASWNSWRDNKIEPKQFDNVPTSGFVLNKKVGGYKTDWNPRQTYVRIYDPRDFEFEITVPNLLYILENTNSIKGKGLEGEFVYGWDGTELLLIPVSSPDYIEITNYSNMISKPESILGKDLILGGIYKTNKNENWIYLGKFMKYNDVSYNNNYKKPLGLHYYFQREESKAYETIKSLSGRIVKLVSAEPVSNYAELMEELEHHKIYSPIDESKNEYVPLAIEEFKKLIENYYYGPLLYFYYQGEILSSSIKKNYDNKYQFNFNGYYNFDNGREFYNLEKYNAYSLEEIFNKFQFLKQNQYLLNGKLSH